MPSDSLRFRAVAYLRDLQDRVCADLERLDGTGRFREDAWTREGGGGGRSRVLADGGVFEKAGVNFSDVHGEFSEEFARQIPGEGRAFTAAGVSLVLHPRNPFVPTVHANFRFLTRGQRQWFGGGADLTPYYGFREDAVHFHQVWHASARNTPGPWTTGTSRNGATNTSSSHTGVSRAASAGSSLTICPTHPWLPSRDRQGAVTSHRSLTVAARQAMTSRTCSPSCATPGTRFWTRTCRSPSAARARPTATGNGSGRSTGAGVRRVQPALRPRHDFRAENGGADRVDPDVAAAARALGVRSPAGTGLARGRANRGVSQAAGLGGDGKRLAATGTAVNFSSHLSAPPSSKRYNHVEDSAARPPRATGPHTVASDRTEGRIPFGRGPDTQEARHG